MSGLKLGVAIAALLVDTAAVGLSLVVCFMVTIGGMVLLLLRWSVVDLTFSATKAVGGKWRGTTQRGGRGDKIYASVLYNRQVDESVRGGKHDRLWYSSNFKCHDRLISGGNAARKLPFCFGKCQGNVVGQKTGRAGSTHQTHDRSSPTLVQHALFIVASADSF